MELLVSQKAWVQEVMFERYAEKARRVILWARYEASQYGSPHIEAEHLLLGLLREDFTLANQLPGGFEAKTTIRSEIEKHIVRRERISTSVEIPLTEDSKKVLNNAAEEAERSGHQHVGTEHLLLGLFQVEGSVAAQILQARGLKLAMLQEEPPKGSTSASDKPRPGNAALSRLEDFLEGLKWHGTDELTPFFAENVTLIDVHGKRWSHEEIVKEFDALFAPYAKKNAAYIVEETRTSPYGLVIAIVLWKNAILASMERVWMHRMSVVLVRGVEDWAIALVQMTLVKPT